MTITLYTHANTPAAQISAPIYAQRGADWFLVNAFTINRIPAPAASSLTPVNEQIMFFAQRIKDRIASIQ